MKILMKMLIYLITVLVVAFWSKPVKSTNMRVESWRYAWRYKSASIATPFQKNRWQCYRAGLAS